MYPKIKNIKIADNYILMVEFDNDIQKKYDFKTKFQDAIFKDLRNPILFNQAKIDPGGYGISWNDDIDISEYELWKNGVAI
ncbi:MAG: DUF2442 domain-containing protein [Candidatus Omnitrophota bacterium]